VENPGVDTWYALSGELSRDDATMVQGIGFTAYVNGDGASPWTGSVYIDDLQVE
jgi:hypothetical protein